MRSSIREPDKKAQSDHSNKEKSISSRSKSKEKAKIITTSTNLFTLMEDWSMRRIKPFDKIILAVVCFKASMLGGTPGERYSL